MKHTILALFLLSNACNKELQSIESTNTYQLAKATKPNVILILIDDMGYEVPTINGGQSYSTPNIDRLAKDGIRFTNCFSTPLCSPSRTELLTGKYNNRNYTAWGDLSLDNKTIGNLMKKAGYATGIFGKWQLGGGDTALKAFGFNNYCVWNPAGNDIAGNRYKNPHLYTHGEFLPDTNNYKYGADIIQDSLLKFIKRSTLNDKPFFAFYPILLVHPPFQPTPDDVNFLSFDEYSSDPIYYPNMVKYMDKLIGQLTDRIKEMGIAENTMVIITADNGTPHSILSLFNQDTIRGAKGKSIVYGTHVPLIVNWEGHRRNIVDSSLIDFSDFLVTLKDIGKGRTDDFGILDGVSFYHNLIGQSGINREWSFCYFQPHPEDDEADSREADKLIKWAQNTTYKKYDTCNSPESKTNQMFNFIATPLENHTDRILNKTIEEIKLDSVFSNILNKMK